jgi:hypothetical protein
MAEAGEAGRGGMSLATQSAFVMVTGGAARAVTMLNAITNNRSRAVGEGRFG